MFLFFMLTRVLAVPYSAYTFSLDPFPISYPNDWHSNIIDLSSNHAGQIVTITINCNVLQELNIGTYVTLIIPGFNTQPTAISLTAIQAAQYDNIFVFTAVNLPSTAGAYGPVSVFVYGAQSGDIIASAVAYGSIQIISAKPAASSLTLAYNAATVTPSSSVSIVFTFSLVTTLYSNDYLVITVPTLFAVASGSTNFLHTTALRIMETDTF
jgi:hypothetical protein